MNARDALVDAVLPTHAAGLPPVDPAHRAKFWLRFDAAAPWPLRVGLAAAALVVVRILPRLTGRGRSWARLDAAGRDAVLARAERWPGLCELMEVAKLAACFLVFDDDRAQAAVRGDPR